MSTMIIDENGNKYWKNKKGEYHRIDGPAIEFTNGDKWWYLNGKFHRKDGPAIEFADGSKKWYLNGELHREDGPAIEWVDGTKYWYLNGKEYSEKEYWKKLKELKLGKYEEKQRKEKISLIDQILNEILR